MAGMGNDVVREARKRAGLTQRELAERVGTTQSAIARLESGRTTPSFDRVVELVRACNLDVEVAVVPYDGSDWAQAQRQLSLSSKARVERMVGVGHTMWDIREAGRARREGAA